VTARADLPLADHAVSTVPVKAVLVSFDFRRQNCELVGRFARIVSSVPRGGTRPSEKPVMDAIREVLGRQ
jgi:hypothetical protein